ncbi:unnamed protein product, partial [Iphiclides podalirius]
MNATGAVSVGAGPSLSPQSLDVLLRWVSCAISSSRKSSSSTVQYVSPVPAAILWPFAASRFAPPPPSLSSAPAAGRCRRAMVSKEPPAGDVAKSGRRRRRRAGSRASRRRARKVAAATAVTATAATAAALAAGPDKGGPSPAKCAVHAFVLRYQSALRKVPAHLPPRVHAGPPSKRVKRVSWRELRRPLYPPLLSPFSTTYRACLYESITG